MGCFALCSNWVRTGPHTRIKESIVKFDGNWEGTNWHSAFRINATNKRLMSVLRQSLNSIIGVEFFRISPWSK